MHAPSRYSVKPLSRWNYIFYALASVGNMFDQQVQLVSKVEVIDFLANLGRDVQSCQLKLKKKKQNLEQLHACWSAGYRNLDLRSRFCIDQLRAMCTKNQRALHN